MYSKKDKRREISINESDYRSPFRRDYARLIHSPAFRRLQGKTQLYPGAESDFFRNRLTHSLEVAQIAKTIAIKLNEKYLKRTDQYIDLDLCEFAGLAHDLGHPPFGHQGEEALDECMRDFGGFEGNAQTLRILSKLEKKNDILLDSSSEIVRAGLNLTYRSLASILKYDNFIQIKQADRQEHQKEKPIKGYYKSETDLVERIKENVVGSSYKQKFKTIECQIMDLADDIAYSTYDLEDGLKAGFYHPTTIFTYPRELYLNISKKVSQSIDTPFSEQDVKDTLYQIFETVYKIDFGKYQKGKDDEGNDYILLNDKTANTEIANIINEVNTRSLQLANSGELRSELTSSLVNKAVEGVKLDVNPDYPSQSKIKIDKGLKIGIEVLKNFTYESQILSPRLKVAEFRGKEIVHKIFKALSDNNGWQLLPNDFQKKYQETDREIDKKRCICDFIAGMTDKYAIEFYGRLTSEKPETIFKPF